MATSEATTAAAEATPPDSFPMSASEFCSRASKTDKRVELLGAFYSHCKEKGLTSATEDQFHDELLQFARRPV